MKSETFAAAFRAAIKANIIAKKHTVSDY